MSYRILPGDCIEAMRGMDEASVDAVVTDPPYGIGFMGKEWDGAGDGRAWAGMGGPTGRDNTKHSKRGGAMRAGAYDLSLSANQRFQTWCEAWAREAFRILKPGGHLVSFGGTRTYHRLTAGIEDAGFEIRDCLAWLFGSGFPKSLDVSKAIDKAAGAEPIDLGQSPNWRESKRDREKDGSMEVRGENAGRITAPATPEAAQWQGWGTALKPAHEPIVLARKPLTGTVAGNVLEFGVGALNVDGTRIETDPNDPVHDAVWTTQASGFREGSTGTGFLDGSTQVGEKRSAAPPPGGRWPANVILDEQSSALLDEQSGERQAGARPKDNNVGFGGVYTEGSARAGVHRDERIELDSGGASRFFYTAKASRAERNAGLEGFEAKAVFKGNLPDNPKCEACGRQRIGALGADPCDCAEPRWAENRDSLMHNVHPTVKPIALMRWLCRLVTPPGGTILDPFTGSGTTGCAAVLEGFDFVGCEREEEYVRIAEARIAFWAKYEGAEVEAVLRSDDHELRDQGQLDLLGDAT